MSIASPYPILCYCDAYGHAVSSPHMAYPEYNFHSRFLKIDGQRMHYLDEGPVEGDPIVMVHGNPTWSFFFRRLVADLSDRYRAVVPDHIGMGLSGVPSDRDYTYTLASRIDDLEALLEARGVSSNITLIVHDWGGSIGLGFTLRHPERVKRLVILNTAAFHLPEGKAFPSSLRVARTPLLGSFLVRGLNAFVVKAANTCAAKALPPGVRRAYLDPYSSWHNRLAIQRFVQDIPLRKTDRGHGLVERIDENIQRFRDLPVLICWGLRDYIFDADILAEWTQRLPDAEVRSYEDAGHYILEDVGDEVSGDIRSFLERHPVTRAKIADGGPA